MKSKRKRNPPPVPATTEYVLRADHALHDGGCPGRGDKHVDVLSGSDTGCGGTFRCSKCKRTVGWCVGMGDSSRCTECMPLEIEEPGPQ